MQVVRSLLEDDGPFLAGALAYQIFFALFPLLAFAAGLLTWIYLTGAIILIGAEVVKARRG